MVQNQIAVSLCVLPLLFNCWFCVLDIVYCEAVRSAILATAWLLVSLG